MMPCMNCHRPVDPAVAKFFGGSNDLPSRPGGQASVFVCPECFDLVELFRNRARADLLDLLAMLEEALKQALVRGELRLGSNPPLRDLSKKEVLEQILTLKEKLDARRSGTGPGDPTHQPDRTSDEGEEVRDVDSD
jgi:hypothetical protein